MPPAAAQPDAITAIITHLSPVHQAHAEFIAKLAALKPSRILIARGAEELDINLRELQIRTYTGLYLKFIEALVDDLNENLVHGNKVDYRQFVSAFTDAASDYLYAPLHAAAGATEAQREYA